MSAATLTFDAGARGLRALTNADSAAVEGPGLAYANSSDEPIGHPLDEGMRALRLTVLAFILLDLITSVIAHAYGVTQVGSTNLVAIAQSLLVLAAVGAAMWRRARITIALTAAIVGLVFAVGPTGSEFYLLVVTAMIVCAVAAPHHVVLVVAAQLAYAAGYHFIDGPGGEWVPTLTVLAVAAVSDGVGLVARRLIRARDRRRLQVRQVAQQNASARAAERSRLADELQHLVIRDLTQIESEIAGLDPATATSGDLHRGLAEVRTAEHNAAGRAACAPPGPPPRPVSRPVGTTSGRRLGPPALARPADLHRRTDRRVRGCRATRRAGGGGLRPRVDGPRSVGPGPRTLGVRRLGVAASGRPSFWPRLL